MKAVGSEWSAAVREMDSEYEDVGRFVGSLVPGRAVDGRAIGGGRADGTLTIQARDSQGREESHTERRAGGDIGHCATVCGSGEEQATEE